MQSYDLTLAAETDLRDIWRYTYKTWGPEQADKYFDQIEACCEAVGDRRARSKALDGLPGGVHIHRCEHHFIVWLVGSRPVIVAILHERMDFMQRLKARL
jgi:toxin ParE1/3/4